LTGLKNADVSIREGIVPKLILTVHPGFAKTAMAISIELQNGNPPVHVDPSQAESGLLILNPTCLTASELAPLSQRVLEVIG
jgi:hypothetical protein